jgi:hypothetical protein
VKFEMDSEAGNCGRKAEEFAAASKVFGLLLTFGWQRGLQPVNLKFGQS